MSETLYLISKAERDLEGVFKAKEQRPGHMHSLAGNLIGGPIGAGIGSAIGAPEGRKGRAALGAGAGSTAGLFGGAAGAVALQRKLKHPAARGAASLLVPLGLYGGGAAGHHVGVGRGPYKKKSA